MFTHLRLASKRIRRPSPRITFRRNISNTLARLSLAPDPPSDAEIALQEALAEEEDLDKEEEQLLRDLESQSPSDSGSDSNRKPQTYKEFIETIGNQFRYADAPRKWLGGNEAPFPMNPTFKPPPPVSDAVKTAIYEAFMQDPIKNNVRSLSQIHHLSLKRVDAILRLKGMENAWIKGKTLHTGFRMGMEKILGVAQSSTMHHHSRYDAREADSLEEEERRDSARQRYQQLYWESVPEDGREPLVPLSLERAKAAAKRFTRVAEKEKSNRKLMPHLKDTDIIKTPESKVQVSEAPGRPTIKFVDVGGRFIDVEERLRKIAQAERRAKLAARKAGGSLVGRHRD